MNMPQKPAGGMAALLAGPAPEAGAEDMGAPPGDQGKNPYDIPLPDGFQPPDGMDPGRQFDVTMKVHLDENGMICIDAIEGVPTREGDDEKAEEPAEPGDEEEEKAEGETAGQPTEEEPMATGSKMEQSKNKSRSAFRMAIGGKQ